MCYTRITDSPIQARVCLELNCLCDVSSKPVSRRKGFYEKPVVIEDVPPLYTT